ncbi:YfcE family phosphodiesterase [Allomuricauda sp. SCSIO 65647]|uniref:YfcE family phosphodiesterase n=1 Tax=Allomuricauda sp. SCSIO 65647 TaxID=2908843 RepID=UPI001F3F8B05|nr:YfcE family phosphodiesterase [Muricauda sp. SCSIO 65647]UJH68319.1 YfcE family phosphodiesterase [Muricauda sp. SCSIO 65647]
MKTTIISDIHDHVWNLQKALERPELQATEALICCGDLCSPFIIKLLGQGYGNPIHIVLGNNDGDVASIVKVAQNFSNIHIHGEYFRGDLGGISVAANHYPEKARSLAENGGYDVVCYGHNHILLADEMVGDTLLINPGAIMGYHGGELKDLSATFLVLDTETREATVYHL